MIRLITILIVALLVGAGLAWLADNPGQVVINWQSWLVETSLAVLAVAIAMLLAVVLLVQNIWYWARRELPFVGVQRHLRQQRRGLDAMNQTVLALSSGRIDEAEKLIAKTKRLLPPQPMLHVLESQNVPDPYEDSNLYYRLILGYRNDLLYLKNDHPASASQIHMNKRLIQLSLATQYMVDIIIHPTISGK